jgi:hypothetical protein
MINNFIDPFFFFIALFFGLFIVYISAPKPDIIIKYPTPDNAGKVVYKDSAENCYKYKAEQVKCPKNPEIQKVQYVDTLEKESEGAISAIMNMFSKK